MVVDPDSMCSVMYLYSGGSNEAVLRPASCVLRPVLLPPRYKWQFFVIRLVDVFASLEYCLWADVVRSVRRPASGSCYCCYCYCYCCYSQFFRLVLYEYVTAMTWLKKDDVKTY